MYDMLDVTSMHRPDPDWEYTDKRGHVHRWYEYTGLSVIAAISYTPMRQYMLPTLVYIQDSPGDDEYPATGHYECIRCGEVVRPGRTADTTRQFVPGLRLR